MAEYLYNPYEGPRLYAAIIMSGGNDTGTGGINATAFADPDDYFANGDTSPSEADYSLDNLLDDGWPGAVFIDLWGRLLAPNSYKIGACPAGYPGGAVDVISEPLNRLIHEGHAGTSYSDVVMDAIEARKSRMYYAAAYEGLPKFDSATDNATLDSYTEYEEAAGLDIAFDSLSFLSYANLTNPSKMMVDRLFTRGVRVIGESWERRDVADLQGWLAKLGGINALSSGRNFADPNTRPGLAISDPATWHTKRSIGRYLRPSVLIQNEGVSLTPAMRIATMRAWFALGVDVWMDAGGFDHGDNVAAVETWLGFQRPVVPQSRRLQTAIRTGSQAEIKQAFNHLGSWVEPTPTCGVTSDPEGTFAPNSIRFTVTVTDRTAQRWGGRWLVRVYVTDSENGAPSATGNTVTFNSGTVIQTLTPNAVYEVLTDEGGRCEMDVVVSGAASRYVYAAVLGRPVGSEETEWAA